MAVETYTGPECKIYLGDDQVGRATDVTLRLENNVEEFHELGDRDAVEIVEKVRSASGTINRAVINGMLLAKAMNKATFVDPEWTIDSGKYQNPETVVSGESIAADDIETEFDLDNQPPIRGTVVIKRDGSPWGTEDTDYTIDYEDGIITFTVAPTTAYTWTVDYNWGRSYTITGSFQVGDGSAQYLTLTIGRVMFDTWETTVSNTGDVVMENLEYKAITVDGLFLGTPTTGV